MALSSTRDITAALNVNGAVVIDMSGWDYAVLQLVSPAATVDFKSSNDAGAIASVSDGNPTSAINFTAVQGINLATGTAVTTLAESGLAKFSIVGRYLQFSSAGDATKAIVELTKII